VTAFSILFEEGRGGGRSPVDREPPFFRDLNLDALVDLLASGREEYDLKAFFYSPLGEVSEIEYRQEVARDLEGEAALGAVKGFAIGMRSVRERRAQADKFHNEYQGQRWFLDAVDAYCASVVELSRGLGASPLLSRGLKAFREHVRNYVESASFLALGRETAALKAALASVRYCVDIKANTVRVKRYEGEEDYRPEIERIFEKFRRGAGKDYLAQFTESREMNRVETSILERVARLFPEVFERLRAFRALNASFADEVVLAFDREVQFYVAYLDHIEALRRVGLEFCLPTVSGSAKTLRCAGSFDIVLAYKLACENRAVVTNDFFLEGAERVIVVTGPNQGGKTTFARTFGQLHHLARLGLPVPGSSARLFLCDGIYSHFEKEESADSLRGKLQDDLVRLREILDRATGKSVIVLNEIFTSTSLEDAIFLGEKILRRILELDALCVCVTFIDELAGLGAKTVSMMSTLLPGAAESRTFKILRKPADGLAYALSLAEKYGLTRDAIALRIRK
jgi:hypothetical protein